MRRVVAGAGALGAGTLLGVLHWSSSPLAGAALMASGFLAAVPAWLIARSAIRRDRELVELRRVAEMVQQALLRPVPSRLGHVRAEVRYLAAEAGAKVGGDLYAVLPTPFGTRLIIGDVSGKGLSAVGRAADVLGAFRELARHEPSLCGVAMRLDALVRDHPDGVEDFVTALLVGLVPGEDQAEIVYCGHPAPLVLRDGVPTYAAPLVPAPPLGLMDLGDGWCASEVLPFRMGDRLLFYTDGVIEARNARHDFYPLRNRVEELWNAGPGPADFLAGLEKDLLRHTGGRLDDDAALLLVEYEAAPVPSETG